MININIYLSKPDDSFLQLFSTVVSSTWPPHVLSLSARDIVERDDLLHSKNGIKGGSHFMVCSELRNLGQSSYSDINVLHNFMHAYIL